jgi:hypothetical protein
VGANEGNWDGRTETAGVAHTHGFPVWNTNTCVRDWKRKTWTAVDTERVPPNAPRAAVLLDRRENKLIRINKGNCEGMNAKIVVAHCHSFLAARSAYTARQHVERAKSLRKAEGQRGNGASSLFAVKKSRDSICPRWWGRQPEFLLTSATPALRRQRISDFVPERHSLVQRMSRQLRRSPSCMCFCAKEAVQSAAVCRAERLPAKDKSEIQMGMSQWHRLQSGRGVRESSMHPPLETTVGWSLGTGLRPDRGRSGEIAPNDRRVEACRAIPRSVEARRIAGESRFQSRRLQAENQEQTIVDSRLNAHVRRDYVGIPESTARGAPASRPQCTLRIGHEVLFVSFRFAKVANAQKIPIQLERR